MIKDYIIGIDKIELTLKAKPIVYTPIEYSSVNFDALLEDSKNTNLLNVKYYQNQYDPNYIDSDFHLKIQAGKKTKFYNLIYTVCYKGIEYGALLLDFNLNEKGCEPIIKLNIDNVLCYKESEFNQFLTDFLDTYQLRINNISALDIFIDTRSHIVNQFITLFNDKDQYKFVTKVKTFKTVNSHAISDTLVLNASESTFYFGDKKDSGKQIILYNKTKELEASRKGYITAIHNQYIKGTSDVFRFELRLLNRVINKKGIQIDYTLLFDPAYLQAILKDNINSFFDFRLNENERNERCTKVDFFDLSATNLQAVNVSGSSAIGVSDVNKVVPNTKTTSKGTLLATKEQKRTIKNLVNTAIGLNDYTFLISVEKTAITLNLLDYYNSLVTPKIKDTLKPKPVKRPDYITDFNFDDF